MPIKDNKSDQLRGGIATTRFEALVAHLEVQIPQEDESMMGDLASLYSRCGYVREVVQDLLSTPLGAKGRVRFRKKIGTLWAEVDNLASITRDMVGPLDRLHSALFRSRRVRRSRSDR